MPPRSTSTRPEPSALQSFRGEARVTAQLHPLENALLWIVGGLLCLMPWALGTMHVWSQFAALGLSAAAFGVAVVNRQYRGELAPQGDFQLIMWPKLIRFPLFWLGLAFLGYITIQGFNSAWVYMRDGHSWWLEPVDPPVPWLPTGIQAPFAKMNAWRVLVIVGGAWLLTCALWVGITRRITIQRLFTVIAINGAVFAIIGILQKVTHAKHILWALTNANTAGNFFSTIIYKNHAGAYLNLVLMLGTGLLYWHFSRAERRMDRASPAPIFGFCCVLSGVGVLLTGSRSATLLLMAFTLIAFIGFMVRCTLYRTEGRSPWVVSLLCGIFALFIGLGAYFVNAGDAVNRVGKLLEDGVTDSSVSTRLMARDATLEMAQDKLLTGWGAGSFRHYFPVYQRNYPEIFIVSWNPNLRLQWEYAHNDYVQFLAEYGLVGSVFVLAFISLCIAHLVRRRAYARPHLMFIVLALVVTAAHAWVDFPFHNPAIIFLWAGSLALVGRWAELEARTTR